MLEGVGEQLEERLLENLRIDIQQGVSSMHSPIDRAGLFRKLQRQLLAQVLDEISASVQHRA